MTCSRTKPRIKSDDSLADVAIVKRRDSRRDGTKFQLITCMPAKKNPNLSVGRGEKLPVSKGAGLTAKGRAKYNAATGSNLKAPAPHPKTEADKKRKASFCSRSVGWKGERGKAARKRWAC